MLFIFLGDSHGVVAAGLTEHEAVVASKTASDRQQLALVAAVLVAPDLRSDLLTHVHAAGESVGATRIVRVQGVRVVKVRVLSAIREGC